MMVYMENDTPTLDMAEIYRQNYMDARDMVRDLQHSITELNLIIADKCAEIEHLRRQIRIAENHIAPEEFAWYDRETRYLRNE